MSRPTTREILLEALGDEVVAVLKEQGIVSPSGSFPDKLDRIIGSLDAMFAKRVSDQVAEVKDDWYVTHLGVFTGDTIPEYARGVFVGLGMALEEALEGK